MSAAKRYALPDPKCRHVERAGRACAGDPAGVYASTWVCSRPACIEDALAWAEAQTQQPARFIPRDPTP